MTAYKGSEMLSEDAEPVDKEMENAIRYFQPGFMAKDPQAVFSDKGKDGQPRITTMVLSGGVVANPIEDYIAGAIQTRGMENLEGANISPPMVADALYKFIAGEPIGAYFDEPGVREAAVEGGKAIRAGMKLEGRAAQEQFQVAKEYGIDAMIRAWELASKPFGPIVEVPSKVAAIQRGKERFAERATEERDGKRVPKGFGPQPGKPISDYEYTQNWSDLFAQGVVPLNTKVIESKQMQLNMTARAAGLYRKLKSVSEKTTKARKEMSPDEIREDKKPFLDTYINPWIEYSGKMLEYFGSTNIKYDQADMLAKSGLADWEIEYLLGIKPRGGSSGLPGIPSVGRLPEIR